MLVKMTLSTLAMISNFRINRCFIYIHIYKYIYIYIYIIYIYIIYIYIYYIYILYIYIYIYKAILRQFLAYPLLKVRDWMV